MIRVRRPQVVDVVVIGGGVAGVLSSARLAAAGFEVVLVERDRLGSGATVANHGIVHSGAMYAQFHPGIVAACQQAQNLVRTEVPSAVVGHFDALYYGLPERMKATVQAWNRVGLPWAAASPATMASSLLPAAAAGVRGATAAETVVASRQLLVDLTGRALTAGVRVLDATPVTGLRRQADRWIVTTGSGFKLQAGMVVSAAGAANATLLAAAGSARAPAVRSRLEVMVAVPTVPPAVPALCLDYGGPTLVPTRTGALISVHGAPRVDVKGPTRLLPVARTAGILDIAAAAFPGLAGQLPDAVAYSCVKTELVDRHADRWGSRPGAAVLDHAEEHLPGLFTVVPGKMTLAFQATATLTGRVLGVPVDVSLPPPATAEDQQRAEALVAAEPWRPLPGSGDAPPTSTRLHTLPAATTTAEAS